MTTWLEAIGKVPERLVHAPADIDPQSMDPAQREHFAAAERLNDKRDRADFERLTAGPHDRSMDGGQ